MLSNSVNLVLVIIVCHASSQCVWIMPAKYAYTKSSLSASSHKAKPLMHCYLMPCLLPLKLGKTPLSEAEQPSLAPLLLLPSIRCRADFIILVLCSSHPQYADWLNHCPRVSFAYLAASSTLKLAWLRTFSALAGSNLHRPPVLSASPCSGTPTTGPSFLRIGSGSVATLK